MIPVDLQGEKPRVLDLRILGPVDAWLGGTQAHLTGLQRSLLAMLTLAGGHVVSTRRLAAGLWDTEPPSAPARVRAVVADLRRALGGTEHVLTRAPGYRIDPALVTLDSNDFTALTERARAAQTDGEFAEAVRLYDEAMSLWRGPALGGAATGPFVAGQTSRLEASRLHVVEEQASLNLELGMPHVAIAALADVPEQRPPRERTVALLMLAHYRSGHTGDALQVYQRARLAYRDELGLDPGGELTRLHQRILHADPALIATATPVAKTPSTEPAPRLRPAQLPPDLGDFTGRDAELDAMLRALDGPAAMVAVHGRPGIGKSALATRVGHRLRARFPDGQIYADLAGAGPRPADPHDVLAQFLAALGVTGSAIPAGIEARTALYRSVLAEQRVLILLDNAASATQLRPLLPSAVGCSVIITSRTAVAAPLGARGVEVDLFDAAAGSRLVAAIIGADRAAAESDEVDRLVALCGRLPLALRVAAGRLAESPHWQVATLVERLGDERQRLHELRHGGVDLYATLLMSHRALSARAAEGLRLLGVPPPGDFARWTLAAMLDVADADAAPVIDELIRAGLLDYCGRDQTGEARYRLHDLIRSFAVELADRGGAAQARQAEQRLFGAWLAAVETAGAGLPCRPVATLPGPEPVRPVVGHAIHDAITWFESERVGLRTVVAQAARGGSGYAYRIAAAAVKFAELRGHYDDGRVLCQAGLSAATISGDRSAAAYMRCELATVDRYQDRFGDARRGYEQARAAFIEAGDTVGATIADAGMAVVLRFTGDVPASIALSETVIEGFTKLGDELRAAQARHSVAVAYCDGREWDLAARMLRRALPVLEAAGDRETRCRALGVLGFVHLRCGEYDSAREHLEQSVAMSGELGMLVDAAYARATLSQLHAALGRTEQAHETMQISLRMVRAIGDRSGESRMLIQLAELYAAQGRYTEAVDAGEQAVRISHAVGNVLSAAQRQEYVDGLRRTSAIAPSPQ